MIGLGKSTVLSVRLFAHRKACRLPFTYLHHPPDLRLALSSYRANILSNRTMSVNPSSDHSSQSNPYDIAVVFANFDLTVDFSENTIRGIATVTLEARREGVAQAHFDTRELQVSKIVCGHKQVAHHVDQPHKVLGSRLVAQLEKPIAKNERILLSIHYSTSASSTALQWLEPSQTAGGKQPYLFSQCQAIHARSFIPCQDTPAVKNPYTATVSVPKNLKALMSANLVSEEGEADDNRPGFMKYSFVQRISMPSYLVALAVGELEPRVIGPRSKVWSEPSQVEAAAYEFEDTTAFLQAGEDIAGPYVWGNYDLLLLPPSFPYGGMENPCLTFVTPTLVAGDRSLVGVVAHEISHSWFGNLVSNRTWQDFWLNEGWTVFLERRILGRLKGHAAEQFSAANGLSALQEAVDLFGADHPFTQLVPDLSGGLDPDDAFSKVPYEKGFYFLYYLEQLVGGAKDFEPFMRAYIDKFKHGTVDSQQFKDFFCKYFQDRPQIDEIDWQTWYFGRGMPPLVNKYDTHLADKALELAQAWHLCDVMGMGGRQPRSASRGDLEGWSTEQIVAFLDKLGQLRAMQPMHASTTRKMDELYNLDSSHNCEIMLAWFRLAIAAGDKAVLPLAASMLKSQGRMKYLRPLYRALYRSKMGRDLALQTFNDARSLYHPIASKMVATDLGIADGTSQINVATSDTNDRNAL